MSNTEKAKELEEALKQIFKNANYDLNYTFEEYHFIALIREAYQLGQSQQPDIKQWVSLKNGLTPYTGRYLTIDTDGEISINVWDDIDQYWYVTEKTIVAYMDLPEPPNSTTAPKTDISDTLNQALAKRLYAIQQILNEWPGSELSKQIDAVLNPDPETIDNWHPGDLVMRDKVVEIIKNTFDMYIPAEYADKLRECITKIKEI